MRVHAHAHTKVLTSPLAAVLTPVSAGRVMHLSTPFPYPFVPSLRLSFVARSRPPPSHHRSSSSTVRDLPFSCPVAYGWGECV